LTIESSIAKQPTAPTINRIADSGTWPARRDALTCIAPALARQRADRGSWRRQKGCGRPREMSGAAAALRIRVVTVQRALPIAGHSTSGAPT
jgi:hypothetical protein